MIPLIIKGAKMLRNRKTKKKPMKLDFNKVSNFLTKAQKVSGALKPPAPIKRATIKSSAPVKRAQLPSNTYTIFGTPIKKSTVLITSSVLAVGTIAVIAYKTHR